MNVLVTGASGFIGSRLCREISKHDTVIGISRSGKINTDGIISSVHDSMSTASDIETVACDLVSFEETHKAIKSIGKRIDCVIHLAGLTFSRQQPPPSAQDYFNANFMSTLNLLDCCRIFGIRAFALSSSIAVYGLAAGQHTPQYLPVDEKHEARPYESYDASKHHAEQLCSYYQDRFGISAATLRYSRVYGPGQDKGIIYYAISKSLKNQPIEVKGDISTDFVYVDDVVKATISAAQSLVKNDGNASGKGTFNIGGGREITLYDLCAMIIRLTGSSSEINYSKDPKSRFSLDISRARNHLGYQPISLEEGLIKSIQYSRNSFK